MRMLPVALLLAVGCGGVGPTADGTWSVSVSAGSASCSGTMTVDQRGENLTGGWGCGALGGNLVGTLKGTAVSIQWQTSCCQPMLITGTLASSGTSIAGSINGSGYTGQSFTATKH